MMVRSRNARSLPNTCPGEPKTRSPDVHLMTIAMMKPWWWGTNLNFRCPDIGGRRYWTIRRLPWHVGVPRGILVCRHPIPVLVKKVRRKRLGTPRSAIFARFSPYGRNCAGIHLWRVRQPLRIRCLRLFTVDCDAAPAFQLMICLQAAVAS